MKKDFLFTGGVKLKIMEKDFAIPRINKSQIYEIGEWP